MTDGHIGDVLHEASNPIPKSVAAEASVQPGFTAVIKELRDSPTSSSRFLEICFTGFITSPNKITHSSIVAFSL